MTSPTTTLRAFTDAAAAAVGREIAAIRREAQAERVKRAVLDVRDEIGRDTVNAQIAALGEIEKRLADQTEGLVRDHLREERLGLDEALFAARKRFDRISTEFEERLSEMRDGEPGPPGERGEPGPEGLQGCSFRIRGTWIDINEYRALDVVAIGGASFAARHDDPGPCPGDGWQLIAAQGKRGNAGERGPAGLKGDRGDPGLPVVAMSVNDEGMLTLVNGDGSTVACDLYPLLTKVAR